MKVRAGFVSNSSSSSYIVVLPDNFNPDTDFNWKAVELYLDESGKDENGQTKEQALKVIKTDLKVLLKSKITYSEEGSMYALFTGMGKYVVNTIEGVPGYDTLTILDNKKLRKILESSIKITNQPEAK